MQVSSIRKTLTITCHRGQMPAILQYFYHLVFLFGPPSQQSVYERIDNFKTYMLRGDFSKPIRTFHKIVYL